MDPHDPSTDAEASEFVANARRRHGAAGAILAAGMLAVDQVLGRKPKEEAPIVVASPTEPTDIDTDGIEIPVDDDTTVFSPPRPSTPPLVARSRSTRGRQRR